MKNIRENLFLNLNFFDIYTILILSIYCIFDILLFLTLPIARIFLFINLLSIFIIIAVAFYTKDKITKNWQLMVRKFYLLPIILYIYNQVFPYINLINPYLFDAQLANLDKMIFGISPSVFLFKYANPFLTEYLQISYFLFYFYPLLIGYDLLKKNKKKELFDYVGLIFFSFYFSYLLYFLFPAIGPRFFLHNFALNNIELPGIFFSDIMRMFINSGGGILPNHPHPELIVNKDCFPSGHTMMTFITINSAFKYNSKYKYLVLVLGSSLIFSTIYLRYHYVVDLIAGVLFAFISIKIEPIIKHFLIKNKLCHN